MAEIRGKIIYLKDFTDSRMWAFNTLRIGKSLGWNLELYPGTNGQKETLADNGIKIYVNNKKCYRYMQRPGTQGCFISHWKLWKQVVDSKERMLICEHDVQFSKPPKDYPTRDVVKLEGFFQAKPIEAGNWWEGARAYIISPEGAKKILDWVDKNGAMPADWMLCDGIVDIGFDRDSGVSFTPQTFSFTKDL